MAVQGELKNQNWFSAAGITATANRSLLYQTNIKIRILYGIIVCRSFENTCKSDAILQAEFFRALLKLRVSLSTKQVERLSLMYQIHSIRDEISTQSTTFVKKLVKNMKESKSD